MSNKGQDITTYLEMDISGLKKSISEANANLKLIRSEFNAVSGHTTKWEHSVDLLTKKLESLAAEEKVINLLIQQHTAIFKKAEAQYNDNKTLAEEYKKQLIELTKQGVKKSSEEYQKLARELEVCEGHMYDARMEMKKQDVSINNLNGDLLRTQTEQKKYTEELAKAIKEEERQNSALGELEKTIEDQEKELKELKDAYQDVVVEEGKNSDSAKELGKKINDLSGELNENKTKLNDAKKAADDLDQSLDDTHDATNNAQDGFTVLKGVITRFVADAVQKAIDSLKDLISTAVEFESSFADVRKVLGDVSTEELEDLEHGIRDLALIRPETASEISEITAMAGQLGIRGNDNLLKFTDTMVKLGDSTNLTGEEAAETFAKFMNIMGTSQDQVDRVGATVVNLGNNFATTEKDIAEMSMRLGAAGKLTGMTEAEVMALATALSSVGIASEAGGSAMSKLMINMSNAAANGTKANAEIVKTGYGLRDLQMLADNDSATFKELANSLGYTSDELQSMMDASATLQGFSDVTGLTADEFNKKFGEDAVGTIQLFINSLAGMEDTKALQTLNDMGIKEIRLRDTILRSTTSIENFNKALEISNQGWEENVALDNEANQRYQTTESRMKMVKNRFNEFGIKLKEQFQPQIDAVISALGWLAENAEAVASALLVVVSAISAFLIVTKVIPALKAFNLVLMANPAGMIAAAIAALVAALVILWTKCKGFRDFWKVAWDGIKNTALIAFNVIKSGFNAIVSFFKGAWDVITGIFSGVGAFFLNVFQGAWDIIIGIFSGVGKWFGDRWQDIKDVFSDVGKFFKQQFEEAKDNVVGAFSAIGEWFGDRWDDITSALNDVPEFFKQKFEEAKNNVTGAFSAIGSWFGDRWSDIKNAFGSVGSWFKETFEGARNKVNSAFESIGDWFGDRWDDITGAFGAVGSWFREVFQQAYDDITGIFEGIGEFFQGIIDKIEYVKNLLNPGSITNKIKDWDKFAQAKSGGNKMATGGVLKRGQIGILEGSGAEAVVPLEKNKQWIREVSKDMSKQFGVSGFNIVGGGKGTVNNFTQIINAPKQPSRIELYRQTRNLLNFEKGGV